MIEGLIQRERFSALSAVMVPELHVSIVFEDAFDNKLFSQ